MPKILFDFLCIILIYKTIKIHLHLNGHIPYCLRQLRNKEITLQLNS